MARGARDRTPEQLLQDIVSWGERLAKHIAGRSEDEFLADPLLQDGVCRCVEVLGEAARNLTRAEPDLPLRYPGLALQQAYAT
jgi:uncharacterized protein with HEPN domain